MVKSAFKRWGRSSWQSQKSSNVDLKVARRINGNQLRRLSAHGKSHSCSFTTRTAWMTQMITTHQRRAHWSSQFRWGTMRLRANVAPLTLLSTWLATKRASNLISSLKARYISKRSDLAQNRTKTQSWDSNRKEMKRVSSVVFFFARFSCWGTRRRHWRMWWLTAPRKC